ncbi:MAG: hypothetical protein WC908_02640 [Candidatus Paceibacterota bacterium]
MKNLLLIFFIGFIGFSLLGLGFSDMGPNHKGGCIASTLDGTSCPTSSTDFIEHHISAWQDFTTTLLSPIFNMFLFFSFLFIILIFIFLYFKNKLLQDSRFILKNLKNLAFNYFYNKRKVISWLSLLELSPAI